MRIMRSLFLSLLSCSLVAGCDDGQTNPILDASTSTDGTVVHADNGVDLNAPADMVATLDRGGDPDQQTDAPVAVPCKPPTAVQSEADLIAALNALPWQGIGPYSSKVLQVSDDFQFTTEVTLDAAKVAVPSSCMNASDCRHEVAFQLPNNLAGATCKTKVSAGVIEACKVIAIKSTTVRFRANFIDTHPSQYNFVPLIRIVPECNAPCAQGEIRCLATNTCWASFLSYCKLCLAKDNQACPCLTEQGPKAEGTSCYFMVSGDVVCEGECKDGVCEYTGKPGWAGCP
jgi:hypothetical protein